MGKKKIPSGAHEKKNCMMKIYDMTPVKFGRLVGTNLFCHISFQDCLQWKDLSTLIKLYI